SSEGDQRAVRRKDGIVFNARAHGESARITAFARDAPEIAGMDKDNMGAAEGGFLQEQVRVGVAGAEARRQKGSNKPRSKAVHGTRSLTRGKYSIELDEDRRRHTSTPGCSATRNMRREILAEPD